MKVSLKWLRDYVDVDWSVEQFVERLTMAGLEEESVEDLGAALAGIVVGKVVEREPHPNADRLSVCRVDVGEAEPRTIVCGAPNVAAGQTVPVVLPGSQLPDGTKIGKAKLRGVASEGMICSEVELGLGDDGSGILVLPDEFAAGAAFAQAAGLDDTIIDLEITPNRPDCLSHVGIAREVAALARTTLTVPQADPAGGGAPATESTSVTIDDTEGCGRYVARVLRGVAIGPSPAWLQDRLRAVGQRPINNVVDVTNFVMLELGQPLHAFDLQRLQEQRIVVRRSRAGERLTTLDGAQHTFDDDSVLLIADATAPVAIAGVMGGADSEVTEATTEILLESAWFDPRIVRAGARRLGLHTEASSRFERGADPQMAEHASRRAAALIAELAGGTVAHGAVDEWPGRREPTRLSLRPQRAADLLALPLDAGACRAILERLGCSVADGTADTLDVTVPSFRPDLEREIDLIEEVGRIHGYGHVAASDQLRGPAPTKRSAWDDQRQLRGVLIALGLDEALTTSIVHDDWVLPAGDAGARLSNPPADGQSCLRSSLVPGLLDVARRNLRQRAPGAALFEVGRVFLPPISAGEPPVEPWHTAGLLTGRTAPTPWRQEQRDVDLLDLKGIVEALLEGVGDLAWEPAEHPFLRRGQAAAVHAGQELLGHIGQLHAGWAERFDLPSATYIFELDCQGLFAAWSARPSAYRSLPRFPPIERDLAVVLDDQIPAARVADQIQQASPDLIEDVRLFDVYVDDSLGAGQRSLAFSLRLRSADRTLEDSDADGVVQSALQRLENAFGARQR
jgi:phenylalanyl-tRNA synthetase beta chain